MQETAGRCVTGPYDDSAASGPGRFRSAAGATYAIGNLQAFSPLIPADADRSGIPAAVLPYVLTNTPAQALDVSACGSPENSIGSDGATTAPKQNINLFRQQGGVAKC